MKDKEADQVFCKEINWAVLKVEGSFVNRISFMGNQMIMTIFAAVVEDCIEEEPSVFKFMINQQVLFKNLLRT